MPVTKLGQTTQTLPHRGTWPGAAVQTQGGLVDVNKTGLTATLEKVQFTYSGEEVTCLRPIKVEGWVWDTGGAGRDELLPAAEYVTGKYGQFLIGRHPSHSIGGHLFAVSLAGPDSPENLVSVSTAFNSKMKTEETAVRHLAAGPLWLAISVPEYHDDGDPAFPWIPKKVVYEYQKGGKGVSVPITQDLFGLVSVIPGSLPLLAPLLKARDELSGKNWRVEAVLPALKGKTCLPPADSRPYAALDYIVLEYNGTFEQVQLFDSAFVTHYKQNVGTGEPFSKVNLNNVVRNALQQSNAALHQTRLLSDAHDNPASILLAKDGVVTEGHLGLVIGGGVNAPEIDHIYPENLGGANCFSNAQLTSKSYNAAKGKKIEQLKLLSDLEKQTKEQQAYEWLRVNNPGEYAKLQQMGVIK